MDALKAVVRITSGVLVALACNALAAGLDPTAVTYIPPDQIQWKDNAAGTAAQSVIYGDPNSAKGIHYDGAKQGDVILMIHGEGPATSTPAEKK